MDVGIIGLGAMGGPMAAALAGAGQRVLAYDVSSAAVTCAAAAGAVIATSSAEVGANAPVVLLSLPSPAHVASVVEGDDGLLSRPRQNLVIVDTSTVDPDSSRRLAQRAEATGVAYLDAPVLGRPDACGRWTFPVGGDAQALERARPVLEALGAVTHVGASGTGNAIKLLNNLMFGAINAISAEVMASCEAVGVSPRVFFETVAGSQAATVSPLFRQVGSKIVDGDFTPTFTIDLMHKDVSLALDMLATGGVSPQVGDAVLAQIERAREAGLGREDTSAVVKLYELESDDLA
jgi:3-hydroxyisobutyrate dehydrogenase-like beta-hydroxyacid dehydrogenase